MTPAAETPTMAAICIVRPAIVSINPLKPRVTGCLAQWFANIAKPQMTKTPYDRLPFEIAAPSAVRRMLAKTTAAAQPSWTWEADLSSKPSVGALAAERSDLKIAATVLSATACLGEGLSRRVSLSEVNLLIECLCSRLWLEALTSREARCRGSWCPPDRETLPTSSHWECDPRHNRP